MPLAQVETRRRSELANLRARAERADVETFRRLEDRVFGAKLPERPDRDEAQSAAQRDFWTPYFDAAGASPVWDR